MSSKGTIVALAAAGLLVGFFLGREAGQAPVVFPDVDQGRSEAEMYEAVTAALHEPRAFVRSATLTRLFEGLTEANIEGARRAVSARSGLGDPVDIQLFVSAWVQLDPIAALRDIQTWPVKSRRRIGFNAAVREWAASGHGVEAGNYVQLVEDADLRRESFGPLVRGWALSGDFKGALDLTQFLFHERDADVVDGFVRGMLQTAGAAQTLDVARQILEAGDGPFEQRFVTVALNLAGREAPAIAADVLRGVFGDSVPEWLRPQLDLVGKLYRTRDPQAAIEWLLGFVANPERDRALRETAGFWAIRDYEAGWSWFETDRGPFAGADVLAHDDSLLLAGFVRKMARIGPVEASQWVLRIREGEVRDAMLNRTAFFYARADADAAEAWIDGLGLASSQAKVVRAAAERGQQDAANLDQLGTVPVDE